MPGCWRLWYAGDALARSDRLVLSPDGSRMTDLDRRLSGSGLVKLLSGRGEASGVGGKIRRFLVVVGGMLEANDSASGAVRKEDHAPKTESEVSAKKWSGPGCRGPISSIAETG
jgi:hypothetical protein